MCQHLLEQVSTERLIIGVITGMDLPERTRENGITYKNLPQKQDPNEEEAIS